MTTERRDFNLHERVKGQRIENVMQFSRAFDIKDAYICKPPCDAPKVRPLAL
jgi:hypothetical protein